MKRKSPQIAQSVVLRWLTSAAVLLYVLVPQVGICRCTDCHCCKHSDSHEIIAEAETTESLCCCGSKTSTLDEKPEAEDESDSCPCLLKPTFDQTNFISKTSISLQNISDDFLTDGYLPYTFSILPVTVEKIVSFYNRFESPTSRLSVRLHLLLLVLLN